MKTYKEFKIIRTKAGHPAMSAGGGAYTNTYYARTVLAHNLTLKTADFIKTAGHLASSTEQAIVPIQTGDIIVELEGLKPATDQNPDAEIRGYEITEITEQSAIGEKIEITHEQIPVMVIEGSQIYHNRDGNFFVNIKGVNNHE